MPPTPLRFFCSLLFWLFLPLCNLILPTGVGQVYVADTKDSHNNNLRQKFACGTESTARNASCRLWHYFWIVTTNALP